MTSHAHHTAFSRPSLPFTNVFSLLAQAHDVWRQRRALSQLEDRALNDIGLSRRDAMQESARVIWGAPASWLR